MSEISETKLPVPDGEERTILFADIVDSTGLYREHGDERAREIVLACTDLMAQAARANGGTVIERIGDELLCAFDAPDAAGQGAASMHQRVGDSSGNGPLPHPLRIRVGFEHGPVLRTQEGIFGTTVHTAARLASLAKAGQTLTTRETLDRMHPVFRLVARSFGRIVFKGYQGTRDVCEVMWDSSATVTSSGISPQRSPSDDAAVEITQGAQIWRVDAQTPRLDIGRHPSCAIQVSAPVVSKLHARLVWDRGRVRVEDLSTNGTYVHEGGNSPSFLHHESTYLSGSGALMLGSESPDPPETVLMFRCLSAD